MHNYLENIDTYIRLALEEDLKVSGDVTTDNFVPAETIKRARIIAKERAVFCGAEIIKKVFQFVDDSLEISFERKDGDIVNNKDVICYISGSARSILKAERTVLNYVGYLSGISSATHEYVQRINGTKAKILDTRKTKPGYRMLEKYAVLTGGGVNHRIGLFDQVMIKDNHFKAIGELWPADIAERIIAMRQVIPSEVKLEVEVDTIEQLKDVLNAHPDIILLDNMGPDKLLESIALVAAENLKSGTNIQTEASGNITLENVRQIAETGVDRISIGAITHSAKNADFSLEIE